MGARGACVGCVLAIGLAACSRHSADRALAAPVADAGAGLGVPAAVPDDEPRFSRPIAAARLGDGSTVVAGLVVPTSSIVAMRVAADGRTVWSKAVLDGVAWSAGAELRALPAPDGAAIVWRGQRGGKTVTQMARVGAGGDLRGPAADVGPAACATDEALAWLEHGSGGTTRVRALAWSASAATDVLTMAADRDPELVCGAHRIFALAGGEDDVTVAIASGLEAGAPTSVLRDRDFGSDEEREHDAYTVGDSLGIVRMGDSGALAIREVGAGPSTWRTLATKISPDDDIVAVDAGAKSVVIVYTHEQDAGCAGASALSVRAVRASRLPAGDGGLPEESLELSPPACDRDPGPFWTGAVERGFVIAWAERGHKVAGGRDADGTVSEGDAQGAGARAPVSSLAYRTLDSSALPGAPQASVQRVQLAADDLVSAGCDRARCYAVALVRPPGSDGMQPEAVRVLAYP